MPERGRAEVADNLDHGLGADAQRHERVDRGAQGTAPRRPADGRGLEADVAEDRFGRDSEVAHDLGFVIARGLDDVHLVEAETLLDLFLEAGVDVYGYSDHGSNGLPRPRAGGWGCDDQLEEH